jgi:hypothetical protein
MQTWPDQLSASTIANFPFDEQANSELITASTPLEDSEARHAIIAAELNRKRVALDEKEAQYSILRKV